jgi:hypothetical protein
VPFAFSLIPFVLLATLNSGGYRYGASDQAFYLPAVYLQLDAELFPRDVSVLTAQTRLTAADEVIGWMVRFTGASLPALFFVLYVGALVLLAWGVWRIGASLHASTWTIVGLLAAMTLRHAIARSGTNTLEGYFHPRILVFALGALAVSSFLRGRIAVPLALLAAAGTIHPTTALWFIVWLATAAAIARPDLRKYILTGGLIAAVAGTWALTLGPLAGRLSIMDPQWREMLASKDYLFPLRWPLHAWIINLAYLPLIAWVYSARSRAGLMGPLERALVLGSTSLVVVFAGALVMHGIGVVLAIQLQPARLFWILDFLATIYLVWALAEGRVLRMRTAAVATASLLMAFSAARGAYVLVTSDRPTVQIDVPEDDWGRVMAFVRTTDKDSAWLADPLHAALYGTSLRVAGLRDVFVEAFKDSALGMYDRQIAVRTADRLAALPNYLLMTTEDFKRIGQQYDLDFMIAARHLDLPLVFESGPIRVYRLQ